jgi:UDP-glucose 6-dehydrogenase
MIGLIGRGVVGGAIENAYTKLNRPLVVVDRGDDFRALDQCTMIWVAVPEWEIANVARQVTNRNALYVIKSTAVPAQFETLFKRFVYVPEFLTAKNANADFFNPPLLPIGTDNQQDADMVLDEMFALNVYCYHARYVTVAEASAIKYYANSFLATKVIFNNQFANYCEDMGVEWNKIASVLGEDTRLGHTHWQVPGPDGLPGYGGACFPKDVRALVHATDRLTLLEQVDIINKSMR